MDGTWKFYTENGIKESEWRYSKGQFLGGFNYINKVYIDP